MSQGGRLGLLLGLYFSQGLPFGFFVQGLPVLMREDGISLEAIGLSSLLAIPWAAKFLWAPLVDRYTGGWLGPRRSWIVPLQIVSAFVLFALAWAEPKGGLAWILAGVFIINLLAATQDIATDALAVDVLPPEERGLGNGVQVGAYRLGMIVGGGVLLMWLDVLGWRWSFWLMGGLLLLATIPALLHREARPQAVERRAGWLETVDHFRQPGAWTWALVLVLYKSFDALATPMVKPMMVDIGFEKGEIGAIVGVAGSIAGLAGALIGGLSMRGLGRRRALLGFGTLQVLAVGTYVIPALGWDSAAVFYGTVVADTFFGGMATTALFTLMMDKCRPHRAAVDYTTQACVVVVTTLVAASISGILAAHLGYAGHFALTTVLCLFGLLGVARLTRSTEVL